MLELGQLASERHDGSYAPLLAEHEGNLFGVAGRGLVRLAIHGRRHCG
jgi:hypothetical protein